MKKINNKGFTAVEIVTALMVVCLISLVGWYVWHGRQVNSINNYDDCVKAKGETNFDEDGPHGIERCTIYGKTFIDDGYLKWNIGQRFSDVSHNENLGPAIVKNADKAPKELVEILKKDNGGCAINDHKTLAAFEIIRVVNNKYAKLLYGCEDDEKLTAYMLAVRTTSGWQQISPTNQFTENGVPSCAMVNFFQISQDLEPTCFVIKDNETQIQNNKN